MGSSYKDYLEALSPPWLQGPRGRLWTRAGGDGFDALVDRLKSGVKARMPLEAPEDALAVLGAERGIRRARNESAASYAARIAAAWETWKWAGTPFGLLSALRAAGYPDVKLEVMRGHQFSLDAAGELVVTGLPAGSWCFDPDQDFWSRFLVLFDPLPAGWAISAVPAIDNELGTDVTAGGAAGVPPHLIDDGMQAGQECVLRARCVSPGFADPLGVPVATFEFSLDDGATWFSNGGAGYAVSEETFLWDAPYEPFASFAPAVFMGFDVTSYDAGDEFRWVIAHTSTPDTDSDEANLIRMLINAWKPSHATCDGIVLTNGELWGYPHAGETWGSAGTWGKNARVLWTP